MIRRGPRGLGRAYLKSKIRVGDSIDAVGKSGSDFLGYSPMHSLRKIARNPMTNLCMCFLCTRARVLLVYVVRSMSTATRRQRVSRQRVEPRTWGDHTLRTVPDLAQLKNCKWNILAFNIPLVVFVKVPYAQKFLLSFMYGMPHGAMRSCLKIALE